MAADTADHITRYMLLQLAHKEQLGSIRHWSNLKLGFEAGHIWIKDLTAEQLQSKEIRSIPFKQLFYQNGTQLFPEGSMLPAMPVPALLWTPAQRALPLSLPALNRLKIQPGSIIPRLCTSAKECEAWALICDLELLARYALQAPPLRLHHLQWTILGSRKALITGQPLLPLPGDTYWRKNNQLLPSGFDFEQDLLTPAINHNTDPDNQSFIVWNPQANWFRVEQKDLKPLSAGSLRRSMQTKKNETEP